MCSGSLAFFISFRDTAMADTGDFYSTEVLSVLATLICFYAIFRFLRRNAKGLPPGPVGLPIVGNLLFFTKNPHLKLVQLTKKYGPVFSVKLGSNTMVALCDFQSIRNALSQDAFTGMPPNTLSFSFEKDPSDPDQIIADWAEQKKFGIHLLKDLGFGRSKMEEHVKEEICCLLDIIDEKVGQPIVMNPILHPSLSNNIAFLIFGRRMHYSDPKRIMLNQLFKDFNKFSGQLAVAAYFPWLQHIMRWLHIGNLHKLKDINTKMQDFFKNEIEEHERTLDPENIRDFIDGFLVQIEKTKDEPEPKKYTRSVLQDYAQMFFSAGVDTVTFTVDWLLLTTAAFPDVQDRVHQEINEVIGKERFPIYKDRSRMPFTHAVIMEVMRWRNIFPLNYFRYTRKDAELNSVFIPKNTCVLLNTWSVSHDATLWGHPDTFRPERFLTSDGKSIRKPEYFIPFSSGKRACPGDSFASIEVFLYFTAILQKFHISPPDGVAVDLEGDLCLSLQPKPQKLVFTRRH